ncbi:bacillithiol system redox-active protein YtxJ [Flagellimonas aequoris]|uniref:Bacillithiol system redox-active protein YtxJ n=1 Tax=Flagellimonas aequoris TaxID=2306997 RepID=A0A418N3V9_9FLAO|nr:bacillithiol system redox-active protein YtxJ [Allomuricauda aequoris]RIV68518.1 bacillithiol system redox-active protein YtxJ [Allomuricauda aequoris]TXK00216.1 bacillithiol system redox-active protein YtxJ [Allomuricauda aequoris]
MGIFDSVFGKKEKQGREKKQLPWIELEEFAQLDAISRKSKDKTQVIYKHSSTCGISSMVLSMFTQSYDLDTDCDLYFLTIQHHRDISNEIAQKFGVRHESPQLLVVKNGEVTFHTSHGAIADIDFSKYL